MHIMQDLKIESDLENTEIQFTSEAPITHHCVSVTHSLIYHNLDPSPCILRRRLLGRRQRRRPGVRGRGQGHFPRVRVRHYDGQLQGLC